jgi:hypothetical protein
MILRQIRSFVSQVRQLYAPGAVFTLVIDNMCAALINDIPLEHTKSYAQKLRSLIRETDMDGLVSLLVESEQFTEADFARMRLAAAPPSTADVSTKQHENVERFLGRRCDRTEAAERTRMYSEVTTASEKLLNTLIDSVHMTQRASATTICFRPFPGGDSRIQAGEVVPARRRREEGAPDPAHEPQHPRVFLASRHAVRVPAALDSARHVRAPFHRLRTVPPRAAHKGSAPTPGRTSLPAPDAIALWERLPAATSGAELSRHGLFRHDGADPDGAAARADLQELHYRFRWPAPGPHGEYDNFFFGIWHPSAHLSVQLERAAPVRYASVAGRNWMMAGAVSAVHAGTASLVHAPADDGGGVAFRGYVLGVNLHSCSEGERILRYWQREPLAEHNGVYSAAVISPRGETLVLSADLFGMSAIYYARLGEVVIFSTSPRHLVTAGAEPDRLAWRCLLETGFIAGDRSLTSGVERLPAGKALRASRAGIELVTQFDFERMPAGTRTLDTGGIREVERLFQTVMDRCLAVQDGELVLPLSSGHDSRRMLAALVDRRAGFDAVTCRVFHAGRDLDATYAAQMARDFGFPHRVVEPPQPAQYADYDVARRLLVDGETFSHAWAIALNDALPKRPCTLLDGLAGDILGNPGFRIPTLYRSPAEDTETMIDASVKDAFRRVLRPRAGRAQTDVRRCCATISARCRSA